MGVGFSNLGKLTETRWRISNLNPQGSRSYYIVAEKKHIYIYIYESKIIFQDSNRQQLKKQDNLDNLPEQK